MRVICGECFRPEDDPEGHAPSCRSWGGWGGARPGEGQAKAGQTADEWLGALSRAAELCQERGYLRDEADQRLLNDGIALLRLLRNDKGGA